MVTGWSTLFNSAGRRNKKTEFVSVDARLDYKTKDTRSYEMLSRDSGKTLDTVLTPDQGYTPTKSAFTPGSPPAGVSFAPDSPTSNGRRTPDYFSQSPAPAVLYKPPPRSFTSPQPPQSRGNSVAGFESPSPPPQAWNAQQAYARPNQGLPPAHEFDEMNPLGMNRI